MKRSLPDDLLAEIRARSTAHYPFAFDSAPNDRRLLLAEVDRLRAENQRLRFKPQQLRLFDLILEVA